ncbi:hypothetical protein FKG94_14440 [Exilibacterium tricleocarpae]|uniref:ThuA domain-containing protein n=1 Tax=Exilibacterium tricleocarpae TaxID=2591008 RepID=A0A545TM05_9GAMM|nr:hypothetical protein [Exilibacterium tricleocarpae]TQV78262.1 hypothetical protein FKG94_14440 [Exilibacterium tricleocarpae]
MKRSLFLLVLLAVLLNRPALGIEVPSCVEGQSNGRTVLLFVASVQTYWSEYKTVYESFCANGYEVHVVSGGEGPATSYGDNIQNLATTGPGGYDGFTASFASASGQVWDAAWNAPAAIPVHAAVVDIPNMDDYDALAIVGGEGILDYRYDNVYPNLQTQEAAAHLNTLAIMAVEAGKPVGGQCHGATPLAFFRVPGTEGAGPDGLGTSVLAGRYATGYHLGTSTQDAYTILDVNYNDVDRAIVDGPDPGQYAGLNVPYSDLFVTARDWIPQTGLHFTRTLMNMMETYPAPVTAAEPLAVVVLGGDEVYHYQNLGYTAADEDTILEVLNDPVDEYHINAQFIACPPNGMIDANLLTTTDVIFVFCHNTFSQAMQNQIVNFADNGGGVVGVHHAIYNHGNNKMPLVSMFGAELPATATLNNPNSIIFLEGAGLLNINIGHFVSTHGMPSDISVAYTDALPIPNPSAGGGYFGFTFPGPDELYPGITFNNGVEFGRGANQIERLFGNNTIIEGGDDSGELTTSGWVKRFDSDQNGVGGRVVYLQPGETPGVTFADETYRHLVKNAVLFAAESEVLLPDPDPGPDSVQAIFFDDFATAGSLANYTDAFPGSHQGLSVDDTTGTLNYVQNANLSWYAGGTSTFLSRSVAGNFIVEAEILTHAPGDIEALPTDIFRVAGLLARSQSVGDDWLFPAIGASQTGLGAQTLNTDNGTSYLNPNLIAGVYQGRVRLCRVGDAFSAYVSTDSGQNWQALPFNGSAIRSDMGEAVDIGIASNAYLAGSDVGVQVGHFAVAVPTDVQDCTAIIDNAVSPEPDPGPGPVVSLNHVYRNDFASQADLATLADLNPASYANLVVDEASQTLSYVQLADNAWWAGGTSAFLSTTVNGDFVASLDLSVYAEGNPAAVPTGNWRLFGLLVRDSANAGDWFYTSLGAGADALLGAHAVSTDEFQSTLNTIGGGATAGELRLCRIGQEFRSYISTDAGANWTQLFFPGSGINASFSGTVEVGIASNAYGPGPNVQGDISLFQIAQPQSFGECLLPIE